MCERTLVIILGETRAHELTFENIKKNLLDVLDADLCLCIGAKHDYDYSNPFYKNAKYKFIHDESIDYEDAYDYAFNIISSKKTNVYESLPNCNFLYGKLDKPKFLPLEPNIIYHGEIKKNYLDADDINFINNSNGYYEENQSNNLNSEQFSEIIIYSDDYEEKNWRNAVYGIKKSYGDFIFQPNVITYKKTLNWREFLKLGCQFMGGVPNNKSIKNTNIKFKNYEHEGSGGILIFLRWFLLKNLFENDLLNKYDRFIITRSDFIYQLPHPLISMLDREYIWFPDSEYYGGFTDRHVILSKSNIICYLNIFHNMVLRSNEFYIDMKNKNDWNLEQLIKFNLNKNNALGMVKEFPYIMYSVRAEGGSTSWSKGEYSKEHGYYIKYKSEYEKSSYYKNMFDNSNFSDVNEFYKSIIPVELYK